RDEAAEDAPPGRFLVQVKGLRIVLLREGDDLLRGDGVRAERARVARPDVLPVLHPIPFSIRGSRASRSQSPHRLMASTSRRMASPGKSASHQPVVMYLRTSSSMAPQLGVGGGSPSPRKDSDFFFNDAATTE